MRVMVIIKANKDSEAGILPDEQLLTAMGKYNKATGGVRFLKTEILELSLVAIPANAEATIHSIKALDLAATGRHPSRDRDPLPIVRVDKGARPMEHKTTHEQITGFENTRAAKHSN